MLHLSLSPGAAFLTGIIEGFIYIWSFSVIYKMWDNLKIVNNFRKELDEKAPDQT